MFGFIKKIFIGLFNAWTIASFGKLLAYKSKGPIKCASLNNQPCQAGPTLVNINSDETLI